MSEFDDLIPGGGGGRSNGGKGQLGKLSIQDQKFLNDLRPQSQSGQDTEAQYRRAMAAVKRVGTGPNRAAWLDAGIPEQGGGLFDKIGGAVGSLMIAPQTVDDFQMLKGLSNERVLQAQIAQKGPQTESDAARMAMTEISPYKTEAANNAVIKQGTLSARLAMNKTPFYTQWANKFGGVNGVDPRGRTVDQAWAEASDIDRHRYPDGMDPNRRFAADGTPGAVVPGQKAPPPQAATRAVQPIPRAPMKGQVIDGHKFLGGNPADPKSWGPM